jgi:RHS repeat-associated protein
VQDGPGNIIANYYYDPFGRRLWKEVGNTKTYFLYADEGLVGEFDVSGIAIKAYGYKPGSTWTTDQFFMKEGGNYYFYHNDHLGTPQKMTNISGAIIWSATYDAFGRAAVDAASTITNNLRFPGQYFDQETGFHYNWNRYYDPNTGRYITEDPVGFEGHDVNFYVYVGNNPTDITDPSGLDERPGPGEQPPREYPPYPQSYRCKGHACMECDYRSLGICLIEGIADPGFNCPNCAVCITECSGMVGAVGPEAVAVCVLIFCKEDCGACAGMFAECLFTNCSFGVQDSCCNCIIK